MALGELLPDYYTRDELIEIVENAFPVQASDITRIEIAHGSITFDQVTQTTHNGERVVKTVVVPVA